LSNIRRLQNLIKTEKENNNKKSQKAISVLENFLQKTYAYKKRFLPALSKYNNK
jgi:hypothetical protein